MPRAPENSAATPRVPSDGPPIVCYVTDSSSLPIVTTADRTGVRATWLDHFLAGVEVYAALLDSVVAASKAGADWIQIREKNWEAHTLLAFLRNVQSALARLASAPKLIINDRLDVALSADGVQLGAASIPVEEAVHFLRERNAPSRFILSASCHSLDEARAAESAGATHIFFGPVFDSPSKRAFGPPQGLERLADVCTAVKLPVIAIGGITAANAHSCLTAGAAGVAAIREFQDLQDEGRAKRFVEAARTSQRAL